MMNKTAYSLMKSLVAGAAFAAAALPAFSAPLPAGRGLDLPGGVQLVQADCYAIGQQIAAEEGGQLVRAVPRDEGGRPVCVIVYTVPGVEGDRPERRQIVVDQN